MTAWLRTLIARLQTTFGRRRRDAESAVQREMASHIDEATEEFLQRGLSPDEARRAALRHFGGVSQATEAYRDGLSWRWLDDLRRDTRIALRSLWRQPSFFATAVGTLALGIAAPTALFAVVQAALLKPLPYPNAEDIYTVRTTMTNGRFTVGLVASEELAELRRTTDLVIGSALLFRGNDSLLGDTGARQIAAVGVTEGFFDLFGVPMALGRAFTPEDHASTSVRSVLLSDRTWKRDFSSNPAVVGTTLQLASLGPALVVGVAPSTFDAPEDTDFWIAFTVGENIGHNYDAYIRLKPGISPDAVQARLGPMWDALGDKYPDMAKHRIFVFKPLLTSIVGDLGPTTLIAFSATAILLLLAIANVTNLLLARGASRARDLAVRVAIGASRGHLVRQLLAESMVIAVMAAVIGVPLAYIAIEGILAVGGEAIPRADGLRFDPWVAGFATATMTVAGLLVGLLPALTTTNANPAHVTGDGGRGGTTNVRTRRILAALVVAEVTFAVALVAGAGRLLMSARNLLAVDPGFAAEGRLVIDTLYPPPYGREFVRIPAWISEVTQRLEGIGATRVGIASSLPLRREWDTTTFTDIIGRPVDPQFRPNGRLRIVSPGLFEAMGIRIVRGRPFSTADRADTTPVVIVNEAWVAKHLPPDADPLREQLSGFMNPDRPRVIVGVADDVRYSRLDVVPEPVVYFVDAQRPTPRLSFVITTADGRPDALIPSIRNVFAEIDPRVPVEFERMEDVVTSSLVWSRLGVLLMVSFGAVSLLLTGSGVFGVLAFVGAQRHGEMAVRLSLGATRGGVFRMMLAHGTRLTLAGVALGGVVAWWTGGLMSRYVYQVSAADVLVLGGSAAVVGAVALAAAMNPARRAAFVDPARTLRS